MQQLYMQQHGTQTFHTQQSSSFSTNSFSYASSGTCIIYCILLIVYYWEAIYRDDHLFLHSSVSEVFLHGYLCVNQDIKTSVTCCLQIVTSAHQRTFTKGSHYTVQNAAG